MVEYIQLLGITCWRFLGIVTLTLGFGFSMFSHTAPYQVMLQSVKKTMLLPRIIIHKVQFLKPTLTYQ